MSALSPNPTRPAASSERRPISVLFADLAGSTAIAERLDPEDWTVIVGEAFGCMNSTIERYGGTIARLMGDGVLAFFGAPVAHEDDPERAVRCGLDMVQAIEQLAASRQTQVAGRLQVRVGINTGPVVVGMVGTDTAHEYTAMGDTVNVAARMQAMARPGSVLITAATHRFVLPLVESVDVGLLEVKGKSEAVHAFEITGLVAGGVRARGLVGLHSPMIGRDAQLVRLVDAFDVVRAGQGRVATVLGEPGVGKSRLLSELHAAVDQSGGSVAWVEARSLSYGERLPYHVLLQLMRSLIGISAAADESELAEALETSLRDLLGADWQETYAYLGHLLSIRMSPQMQARISMLEMETIKRYVSSLVGVFQAVSRRGPVIVICDDVHWADSASVEVLVQLVASVTALPVLFVLSSRVERSAAGWRLIAGARDMFGDALIEVKLEALSLDDSQTLVSKLLAIESLPAETRQLILAKAEGNPFFVEEIIRMLIDHEAIVREEDRWVATERVANVEIPDTLHGLLLARIDRLPQESKRTLRVASVIGRQFGVTTLERLLQERAVSTRAELGTLEASGLIQIAALQPELEYLFRHALVQEAAYALLLKQDRRSLHRAAAETIIALNPDRERELAGVIGMHFEQAGEALQAAHYLVIAGEHAVERFASKEAAAFFIRAFALVDDVHDDLRLRAAVGAAKAGWTFNPPGADLERLQRSVAGAQPPDQRLVAEALFWIAFLRRQRGEMPDSSAALKQALERGAEIGEALSDPRVTAMPRFLMGAYAAFTGDLRAGTREMQAAFDLLGREGDPLSNAMVSDFLALAYARLGEFSAAEESLAQASRLAGDGDAIARVDVDIIRSGINLERGEVDIASSQAESCAARAEQLGAYACVVASSLMSGAAKLAREDASAARSPLERGEELSMFTNQAPMRTLIQGFLGSVRAQLGDLPRGVASWDQALSSARAMNDRYGEAQTLWARARAGVRQPVPDLSAALVDLDRAIELFEAMEARPALARALHDRAEAFRAFGRPDLATDDERRSRQLAAELNLRDLL